MLVMDCKTATADGDNKGAADMVATALSDDAAESECASYFGSITLDKNRIELVFLKKNIISSKKDKQVVSDLIE